MSSASDIHASLERLHQALATLDARPDVVFRTRRLGKPAPAALLAQHPELPAELLAFYQQMNGVELAWQFASGKGEGYFCVPALTAKSFQSKADRLTFARPGDLALLFDTLSYRMDTGAWLWRSAAHPSFRVVEDYRRSGEDARVLADSLAEYLAQAAGRYFVSHDDPEQAALVASRLSQPPPKAAVLAPGLRVQFQLESSYNDEPQARGTIVSLYTLTKRNPLAEYLKIGSIVDSGNYVLVQTDLGPRYWLMAEFLRVVPTDTPDLYEQVHQDPHLLLRWGQTLGWDAALRRMAQLWGPLVGMCNDYATGSRLVAALLAPLELPAAVALVRELVSGIEAGRETRPATFELSADEQAAAFNPEAWAGRAGQDEWENVLRGLLAGLKMRLLELPVATRKALPKADLAALEAVTQTSYSSWNPNKKFFADMQKIRLGQPPATAPIGLSDYHRIPELPEDAPVLLEKD